MNRIQIKGWRSLLLPLVPAFLAHAQLLPRPDANKPAIRTTAEEVVLDVVVRDKKGKLVRDLGPGDFEAFDNGVKQTIRSIRLVEGREAISKGAPVALDPLRQIRLVTLTFERLSPEGRRFARQAAQDLLKGNQAQNVYYAVIAIDQSLSVLQQFTKDHESLRRAVDRATGGAYAEFAADSERIKEQLKQQIAAPPDGRSLAGQINDIAAASPRDPSQAMMAQVLLDMLQFNESLGREESSRTSVFALLSMIRGQSSLPGRKTILYFTEGLRIPTSLDAPFRSVISTANRSNVTFYGIDARGLSSSGESAAAVAELRAAAEQARQVATDTGGRAVTPSQVKAADTAEESMKANLQTALRDLAESTGGFLIANTNDLRGPLRMVNEEINSYYEIAYSPNIEIYDGRFRKTSVRLTGGEGRVQARSGYFALPPSETSAPLNFFEVPLLKALGATPLPKDVNFRSAALRFQQTGLEFKAALVVEVPLKSLTFTEDKASNTYSARASLVALVKNAQGEVVKKFDRDVPLRGPLEKMAAVREANILYKDQFSGAPGRYTIETAVLDGEGNRIGARRSVFVAAPKPGGVGMSSLAVVRRFEPNAKDLDPEDPFQLHGGRVTPTLAASIPGGKGGQLSIFFVIYPDPAIADKPQAVVEYLQDGQAIGRGAVEVSAPDAKGRIACVMSSSAENMKAGTYEIHAVVKQGGTAAEERTVVTIERPEGQ